MSSYNTRTRMLILEIRYSIEHTARPKELNRARYWYGESVRLSVCPWNSDIVSKRLNISSNFFRSF